MSRQKIFANVLTTYWKRYWIGYIALGIWFCVSVFEVISFVLAGIIGTFIEQEIGLLVFVILSAFGFICGLIGASLAIISIVRNKGKAVGITALILNLILLTIIVLFTSLVLFTSV